MERQLFEWKDWDSLDDHACLQFANCRLKVKIGRFDIGDTIATIVLNYEKGRMDFYAPEGNEPMASFELLLTVGSEVKLDETAESEV